MHCRFAKYLQWLLSSLTFLGTAAFSASLPCEVKGKELRCDVKAGVYDIGDGKQIAARITNTTGKSFRLRSVSIPWFAGDNKSCFAEFGIARNIAANSQRDPWHTDFLTPGSSERSQAEKFYKSFPNLVGQKTFNLGELAFSAKLPGSPTIPPLLDLDLEIKAGDEILLIGANGCLKRDPIYPHNETPMTYRVHIDEDLSEINGILRLPKQDRVMRCQGYPIDIEDPRYRRTWSGPWRNDTGSGLEITSIRTYAVSPGKKQIEKACLRVCEDAACEQVLGSFCGDRLRTGDQLIPLSMWVAPGEYVDLQASNTCATPSVWNYVSYLGIRLPGR